MWSTKILIPNESFPWTCPLRHVEESDLSKLMSWEEQSSAHPSNGPPIDLIVLQMTKSDKASNRFKLLLLLQKKQQILDENTLRAASENMWKHFQNLFCSSPQVQAVWRCWPHIWQDFRSMENPMDRRLHHINKPLLDAHVYRQKLSVS